MSEKYMTVDETNFDEIITSHDVVLIDFWAAWCGPCRMLSPVIEELAADYKDRVLVGKVNVDDCPKLAEKFGIMSIPSVFVFKAGEVKEKMIGLRQKAQIAGVIDKYL